MHAHFLKSTILGFSGKEIIFFFHSSLFGTVF